MLLYADSLIERRIAHIDQGLARLRAVLTEMGADTLEEIVNSVYRRSSPRRTWWRSRIAISHR